MPKPAICAFSVRLRAMETMKSQDRGHSKKRKSAHVSERYPALTDAARVREVLLIDTADQNTCQVLSSLREWTSRGSCPAAPPADRIARTAPLGARLCGSSQRPRQRTLGRSGQRLKGGARRAAGVAGGPPQRVTHGSSLRSGEPGALILTQCRTLPTSWSAFSFY